MSPTGYLPPRPQAMYGFVSIRSYLLLLIAAILIPMLALAAVLAWQYAPAARRTIEASARERRPWDAAMGRGQVFQRGQ